MWVEIGKVQLDGMSDKPLLGLSLVQKGGWYLGYRQGPMDNILKYLDSQECRKESFYVS